MTAIRFVALVLTLSALPLGCSHSLEVGRRDSLTAAGVATPVAEPDRTRCRSLDDKQVSAGTWSVLGFSLAGVSGTLAYPLHEAVQNDAGKAAATAITAGVAFAGATLGAVFKWRQTALLEQYGREGCER